MKNGIDIWGFTVGFITLKAKNKSFAFVIDVRKLPHTILTGLLFVWSPKNSRQFIKLVGKSEPIISVVRSAPSASPKPKSFAYTLVPLVLLVGISITIESVCAIVVVGVSFTQIRFLCPHKVTNDFTDKVVKGVPYT